MAVAFEKVHISHGILKLISLIGVCRKHPICYQMSDRAFASLTPANALARLAFSDVYDALTSRRQNNQADGAQAALRRMLVEPEQTCDDEIVRLRREIERKYNTDGEASETLTEPDTDTEDQEQF